MNNKLQNNQNNQTDYTDENILKELWLGIKNEYRTLIGVDELEYDVKKHTNEVEETEDAFERYAY